ncbi:serine/threonine protein kinase [candidate division CSSED10-310 bacterium]|uniref:Serine/threonine protein kinase n=1 Tax=candidate division CSSED10-310 bacterium TaxID=2855610 RepID=A0ABV6YU10_UNCC1
MTGEQTHLKQGAQLGPYEIQAILGKGGMGIVYRGWDPSLKRVVAIKVLTESLANDADAAKRFTREAQAMANVSHENIIPIYYIGEEKGLIFFSMELVQGKTLRTLTQENHQWAPQEILALTRQIVSGLAEAFKRDIIHRDLKPANIIQDENGRMRLLDFGLSKTLGGASTLTQSGAILGTPDYMSPEQAEGAFIDHRSDIYSLGATLYHLLQGAPPFKGDTPLSVLYKHVNDPLPPLKNISPEIPPGFIALIYRMLAKKPEDRPGDYQDILQELDEIARALEPGAKTENAGPAIKTSTPGARPRRSVVVIFGLMLLFGCAFLLVMKGMKDRGSSGNHIQAARISPATPSPDVISSPEPENESPGRKKNPPTTPLDTPVSPPGANLNGSTTGHTETSPTPVPGQQTAHIAELFSKANDIASRYTGATKKNKMRALLPKYENAEKQFNLARSIFKQATTAGEITLAEEAFQIVLTNFANEEPHFISAANYYALILFKKENPRKLEKHLLNMVKICHEKQYSWRHLNDQLIFLGLMYEKLMKKQPQARRTYVRAYTISKDKSDHILIPQEKEFKKMELREFLQKARLRK